MVVSALVRYVNWDSKEFWYDGRGYHIIDMRNKCYVYEYYQVSEGKYIYQLRNGTSNRLNR